MKLAICLLDMCEGIYMLKGFEESKGALQEFKHAAETGKVIRCEQ